MKSLKLPFLLNEKQFKITFLCAIIILIFVSLFTYGKAYNGVLLYLKVALYFQLLIIISMQIIAILALKKHLIKYISLGGMFFLFASTFYLDNFFYGSTAGSFLRIFVIFSALQVLIVSCEASIEKDDIE